MKICVFCSSKKDLSAKTFSAADEFCQKLVADDMSLVYGGGLEGLMGYIADGMLNLKGEVYGVFPEGLFPNEVAHRGLTELVYTSDLMERKRKMMEMSDAFVVFPGGLGTLDEAIEVITWKSLGCFDKPIVFYNPDGFWTPFMGLLKDLESKKVLYPETMNCFHIEDNIADIFARF